MKKLACGICNKKFHPKGLRNHIQSHQQAEQLKQNKPLRDFYGPGLVQEATQISDYNRGVLEGRRQSEQEMLRRRQDTLIQVLDAAARAVSAMASIVGEVR